jgi:phospholipid/cholesterol/gamma-HCH transport system substrate-binding protein
MEPNKSYFLVGLFVIGTVLLSLAFTIWLTAAGRGDYMKYRIRFAESVSGLSVGGSVKFRGVDVGSVESITIDPKDTRLIRVDVRILKSAPIKVDTVANLKLQGVTGVVFIELSGGKPGSPNLADVSQQSVPEIRAEQSTINALVDRLPELLDKTTHIVDQINGLLSSENVQNVSDIIARWRAFSDALAQESARLDQLIDNSNAAMADLRATIHDARANIEDMSANLDSASGQADAVMRDFRRTSRNISRLSENLEEDPSRLIFPAAPKGVPAP